VSGVAGVVPVGGENRTNRENPRSLFRMTPGVCPGQTCPLDDRGRYPKESRRNSEKSGFKGKKARTFLWQEEKEGGRKKKNLNFLDLIRGRGEAGA